MTGNTPLEENLITPVFALQGGVSEKGGTTSDIVHEMLKESGEIATYFHSNVNRMIYTMQFQDRARQLMMAISAALKILINLSISAESDLDYKNLKEKVTISEDNKDILIQLIQDAAHSEIDKKYILKMFLGRLEELKDKGEGSPGVTSQEDADFSDIEFF